MKRQCFRSVELDEKNKVSHWRLVVTMKASESWLQTHQGHTWTARIMDILGMTSSHSQGQNSRFSAWKDNKSCLQNSFQVLLIRQHKHSQWPCFYAVDKSEELLLCCEGLIPLSNIIFTKIALCLSIQGLLCSSPWYLSVSFITETNNSLQKRVKVAKWQQCTYLSHHLQNPHT